MPEDTICDVLARLRKDYPEKLTKALLPSGYQLRDDQCLIKADVKLRSELEISDIMQLDEDNMKVFLKESTLTMVSPSSAIAKSPIFAMGVFGLVLINTIILGVYRRGMSSREIQIFNIAEVVLVLLFAAEIAFKCYALGFREYSRSKFNG